MMTSEMFEALQHGCKVYVRTGSEEFQELGHISNVEISCEPQSFPTIKNEIIMYPNPDRPICIHSSPEIKIDESGITLTGTTNYSMDICDSLRYYAENLLKEEEIKKEGINMELLNIYKEKSLNNINKYYDELRNKEYNKNEAVKAVNELTEKFRENVNKLIEKYGEDVIVYDECYFEDSIIADIDDTEEILKLHELENECIDELNEKIKEIKAHLQLLPAVEESSHDAVMSILKTYGVVDKDGKVTPYTPTSSK